MLNLLMKIATLDVSLESVSTASGDSNAHAGKNLFTVFRRAEDRRINDDAQRNEC